ncbi:uncharacterized protein LOC116254204 [Nymphaea colorata]|uniref:Uncharacterized protein n=1 Tax=Nymphaea colorata TaxID=210225 RepID=A0A5K1DL94_9MAGN|nr:uncharacterized protein LOC116254204 [Nymphaea colorata]
MVETKQSPAKRRWKAVCRRRRGRPRASYQSLNQLASSGAAAREQRQTRAAIVEDAEQRQTQAAIVEDAEQQQTQAAIVEDATFMTVCSNCKTIYEYHSPVLGKPIRCRHCREVFVAERTTLSTELGGDDLSVISSSSQVGDISTPISASPVRLQMDELNSNDPRRTENHGTTNCGELKTGLSSEDLADQNFNQERPMVNRPPVGDEYFKQGLRFMVNGFFSLAKAAKPEQLPQLMSYGKIILRNFADLGIADSGFGAHLNSLQQQAADVASRESLASSSKASHDSLVDLLRATERETFEARQKKAAIDGEISDCTRQVERKEASLAEAKEREEMARIARIQVEEELEGEKVKLIVAEASSEKAAHDLVGKEEASAKAKKKVSRAEEELQVHMEALKESKAKWTTLCLQEPNSQD